MGLFGNLFGGGEEEKKSAKKPAARTSARTSAAKPVTPKRPSSSFATPVPPPRSPSSSHSAVSSRAHNTPTRTSQLRSTGVKLCCYLNTETGRGISTIIHLPTECDTLEEVLPKIQARMQLDSRMLFAAELFLPDGTQLTAYDELVKYARADSAIIVGCGEPFDPSTVPFDILQFHLHGGGRNAVRQVKSELAAQRQQVKQAKAARVRQTGHGMDLLAPSAAREQTVESNREQVYNMRQEYMQQLHMKHAAQQELMRRVQSNNALHKEEQAESKVRRAEREKEKREWLASEAKLQRERAAEQKKKRADYVRATHEKVKAEIKASNDRLRERRRLKKMPVQEVAL